MKYPFFVALMLTGFSFAVNAQQTDHGTFHMPQASATVHVKQNFSTSFIALDYSRPSIKGRTIFGGLVPYGKIWRTGANDDTKITFGENVIVNGQDVRAGSYYIYTIPGEGEWTIYFDAKKGWEKANPDHPGKNTIVFKTPIETVSVRQNSLRISIEDVMKNSCTIQFAWSDVRVRLQVEAHNQEQIVTYLNKALEGDNPPYGQAARYYLSTNQNLEKATKYIQLAIKQKPKAFYYHWTAAQIYEKRGLHQKALKQAKMASIKARKINPSFAEEYEKHYKTLLNKQ